MKQNEIENDDTQNKHKKSAKQFINAAGKIGAKPFIILVLVLLFLIPLHLIRSLVSDRENYRREAASSILQPKGGRPTVEGFAILLPYDVHFESRLADGRIERRTETNYIFYVPENWTLETNILPEYLTRGIFEVPVFSCEVNSTGKFSRPAFEEAKINESDIHWDEALFMLGVSNKKNLMSLPVISVSGREIPQGSVSEISPLASSSAAIISLSQSSVSPGASLFSHTVFYQLPSHFVRDGFYFTVKSEMQGGNGIDIMPLATDNTFRVTSSWKSPGFAGGWLPVERQISDYGFSAEWKIAGLSTVFPKMWLSGTNGSAIDFGRYEYDKYATREYSRDDDMTFSAEKVQINFVTPVDNYQQTTRSIKYAILFLIIPFLTIFIFEIFTAQKIHPVQYCLIGLADVIFYLLLLSVSEHLPFSLTYWISSAAVCALTLFYTASIFRKAKWGALFAGVQAVSYVFLFGTLQAEDYALLIGTLGIFFVVALLMVLTRKVDWYAEE